MVSSRLSGWARRTSRALRKKIGFRIVRTGRRQPYGGIAGFFGLLRELGFDPKHVLDVGANRGKWTRTAIEYFPDAHYTLLEPLAELRPDVQDLIDQGYRIDWINAGAGDTEGSSTFTVSTNTVSSSFVPSRAQADARNLRQVTIPVRTLNAVVAEARARSLPFPELVKIDAEGWDFKVLAGASDLIGKTDIFLVEGLVCATTYENSALAVLQKMTGLGYRFMDITDLNRSKKHGVLWVCEFAFVRNGSPLLQNATSY